MYFLKERITKITDELMRYFYKERYNVPNFQMKEGNFLNIKDVEESDTTWQPFRSGTRWGGRDYHAWFRTEVKVPAEFDGETIALYISTKNMGWDATNPQFKVFVDGEFLQGVDQNHREVILPKKAKTGDKYVIDLHAYSGMIDQKVDLYLDLIAVDREIIDLYYDIKVPLDIAYRLPEDSKAYIDTMRVLNDTVNILDLRKPRSKKFYDSIHRAREYIKAEYYEKMCGHSDAIATCVGHTHIDVAWLWTVAQTREKSARSFATVLKLMEEYPDYIFMSSQPQLYKFVKEDHPELYARIKEKIESGRWETDGAMWVEADCNVTSGESLVRQLLFGTRFFKEEFGMENKILWLPDVFGYSAALPQILKKSGIDYFMTTKISWNQYNKLPYDTFMWKGIDGTEILTHCITTKDYAIKPDDDDFRTTYNGMLDVNQVMGAWQRYQHKDINEEVLISYGHGDGGGGTTREMLEYAKRLEKGLPGCPRVKLDRAGNFFERLDERVTGNKALPKWVGELYLEYHRGTYTSMARNKRDNRKSEILYQDVEFLSSLAEKEVSTPYPKKDLDSGWETILRNQFHDILPGTSIKEVYDVTQEEYEEVLDSGSKMANRAIDGISSSIDLEESSIVVFNTLSFNRDDMVMVQIPEEFKNPVVVDEDDNVIDLQLIDHEGEEKYVFFAKDIPAKGYKTFTIREANENNVASSIVVDTKKMENEFFVIEIDDKGTLSSIYDKRAKRQVLKPNERGNKLLAFEDKPMAFDNWDIDIYYQEKMWEVDEVEKIEVIEEGPICGKLRVHKKFVDSTIIQDICIYRDIPRIDFKTYVDWKQDQVLLKAAFPVDVLADSATYDIQYGNIERPTHWNTSWDMARFEVCGHKWADISEDGYGVSLLNDCKYGYDIKDSVMRLTLLKAGIHPNPDADIEEHYFTYSLYPHMGGWRDGGTVQMAYNLNVPLYAKVEEPHRGELPTALSMVNTDRENVIIEVVKKAEDSDDIIIRLYECYNRRTKTNVTLYREIDRAVECNLMEKELEEIDFTDNSFSFEIKPYEIKTFKVKLK